MTWCLCDYRLKDTDGAQLLNNIREHRPQTVVIIITGYSDVRIAVEMVKNGAYDYISKPLYPDEILNLVNKALSQPAPSAPGTPIAPHAHEEGPPQPGEHGKNGRSQYVYGESELSKVLFRELTLVAPTDYSVILFGETGTGKNLSPILFTITAAAARPAFVAIDCGSLSKELAASELFRSRKRELSRAPSTPKLALSNRRTAVPSSLMKLPTSLTISR